MPTITPNLWFDTDAEEAANFYIPVFNSFAEPGSTTHDHARLAPGRTSRIVNITRYTEVGPGPAGEVMTVEFELDGQRFVGINGGPQFTFDEAVSLAITCETQDEVDHYWERLTDGGQESQCGWLKDRYGLSWQVVPAGMQAALNDPDPQRAQRAMQTMLGVTKLDITALHRAADGITTG